MELFEIIVVFVFVFFMGSASAFALKDALSKHTCSPCQKDCCTNPKKVDTAAGCQTDPVVKKDDDDKPMGTCCGGNCT